MTDPINPDYYIMTDPINPDYYIRGSLESIQVIEAFVADKPYRWAPLKYLFRAGKKPGQDEVQDLRKAIWWIEREITQIEHQRHAAKTAERGLLAEGKASDNRTYQCWLTSAPRRGI